MFELKITIVNGIMEISGNALEIAQFLNTVHNDFIQKTAVKGLKNILRRDFKE